MRIFLLSLMLLILSAGSFAEAQSRNWAGTRRDGRDQLRCDRDYTYNDYSINQYYGRPYYSQQRFPRDRYYDYYDYRNGYNYAPGVGSSSFYDVKRDVDPYANNRLLRMPKHR